VLSARGGERGSRPVFLVGGGILERGAEEEGWRGGCFLAPILSKLQALYIHPRSLYTARVECKDRVYTRFHDRHGQKGENGREKLETRERGIQTLLAVLVGGGEG